MFYLFVALKIRLIAAIWLVWWAIKQEPDPVRGRARRRRQQDAARTRSRASRSPRAATRTARPRRSSPPRVRSVQARGRQLSR